MRSIDNSAVDLKDNPVALYEEFERVIVDPEHRPREIEAEREEEKRTAGVVHPQERPAILNSGGSYARRVLALMRKPREQWNGDDYKLASRVVEDARFSAQPMEHEPRPRERSGMKTAMALPARDEFDRRLWGLPPRPGLAPNH